MKSHQPLRFARLGICLLLAGTGVLLGALRFSTGAQAQLVAPAAPNAPVQQAGFAHPGVLSSQSQLDFMRQQVMAGREPWKSAYAKMLTAKGASLDYAPTPSALVGTNDPSDDLFRADAQAAYAHALQWVITENVAHRDKSIAIMNAWSAQFQDLKSTRNDYVWQYQLHTAWVAPMWVSAGEIIRYHHGGAANWNPAEVTQFEGMLNRLHGILVSRSDGCKGWSKAGCAYTDSPEFATLDKGRQANWETSFALAITSIGVFENDRAKYENGKARWQIALPRFVYPTGQTGEACRDCAHNEMGIVPLMEIAEIAWHQGDDLYSTLDNRLTLGMEFTSGLLIGGSVPGTCNGKAVMFRSCLPKPGSKSNTRVPGWEIALNHYKNRKALALPNTQNYVTSAMRPDLERWNFIGWTTLTHAENPGETPANLRTTRAAADQKSQTPRRIARLQAQSKTAAAGESCGCGTLASKPSNAPKHES